MVSWTLNRSWWLIWIFTLYIFCMRALEHIDAYTKAFKYFCVIYWQYNSVTSYNSWDRTGDKPVSEAMLVCCTDAYMPHPASMSLYITNHNNEYSDWSYAKAIITMSSWMVLIPGVSLVVEWCCATMILPSSCRNIYIYMYIISADTISHDTCLKPSTVYYCSIALPFSVRW